MIQSESKTYQAHTSTDGTVALSLLLIYRHNTTVKTMTLETSEEFRKKSTRMIEY